MNDRYFTEFDTESNMDTDPNVRIYSVINATSKAMLKNSPLWMRVNFVCNSTDRVIERNINWSEVNKVLFEDMLLMDYNLVKHIKSRRELQSLQENIMYANLDLGAWHKSICRDCGKDFYMTKSEVQYFIDRDLHVPKRCHYCRKLKSMELNTIPSHSKIAIQIAI